MSVRHTAGHLDTNSQTITTDGFYTSGTTARTLTMGSSVWSGFSAMATGATFVYTGSGLTVTANTATVSMPSEFYFQSVAHDWNGLNVVNAGNSTSTAITAPGCTLGSYARTATLTGAKLRVSGSFAVTGTLTLTNTAASLTVESYAPGTPYTISHGPLTTNNLVTSGDITLISLGPIVTAELWEAGSLVAALGEVAVTEDDVYAFTWDAADLATISGADVELRLTSDLDMDVAAVEWNALREESVGGPALVESWGFIQM